MDTKNMEIIYDTELPCIDGYMELFNTTGWYAKRNISKVEMEVVIKNSWYYISAYHNDRQIGFGRIMSDGVMHAMIYEMIIHPDYQGIGIGKRILELLVKKCKEQNIRDVQLFCAKGKKEFYLKGGFEIRPEDAPGMQIVIE